MPIFEDLDIAAISTDGRALVFNTALLAPKSTRSTQGVQVITLKRNHTLERVIPFEKSHIENKSRYRVRTIPATGALLKPEDRGEKQLTL
jgi:DNA gyrase subunit A